MIQEREKYTLQHKKLKGKMVVFVCLGLEIAPLCNEETDDFVKEYKNVTE